MLHPFAIAEQLFSYGMLIAVRLEQFCAAIVPSNEVSDGNSRQLIALQCLMIGCFDICSIGSSTEVNLAQLSANANMSFPYAVLSDGSEMPLNESHWSNNAQFSILSDGISMHVKSIALSNNGEQASGLGYSSP